MIAINELWTTIAITLVVSIPASVAANILTPKFLAWWSMTTSKRATARLSYLKDQLSKALRRETSYTEYARYIGIPAANAMVGISVTLVFIYAFLVGHFLSLSMLMVFLERLKIVEDPKTVAEPESSFNFILELLVVLLSFCYTWVSAQILTIRLRWTSASIQARLDELERYLRVSVEDGSIDTVRESPDPDS